MSRVMQAIDTELTSQNLLNRLYEASKGLYISKMSEEDHWKYFAYITMGNYGIKDISYADALNQFLIAKKDQIEKIIYYWQNSQILNDILQYSKVVSESELNECKFCILFDDRKYGRAMKGNTRPYSLQGINAGIEYFENDWDIYYEAYYNQELVNENNFREIF